MRPTSDGERRRGRRYPFFQTIHYAQQSRTRRGLMQDLSLGGVRLLCHGGVPLGHRVWLSLPGCLRENQLDEPIQGRVVWVRGNATGVQFVDLSPRSAYGLEHALTRYPELASAAAFNLYQTIDERVDARPHRVPAGKELAPGRTLYVPRI